MKPRERLQVPLAVGMFIVWAVCAAAAIYSDKLPVFAIANTAFGLVAYWVFPSRRNGRNNNRKDDE